MNTEQYHRLLHAFSEAAHLDAEKLIDDGLVTVEGLDMLLFHGENINPDKLHVRIDLGICPKEIEEKVWYGLAIANYAWGVDGAAVFSAHPEMGNVILTLAQPLTPDMTGHGLADELQQLAQGARQCWERVQEDLRTSVDHF
jgi:hypothetical protein